MRLREVKKPIQGYTNIKWQCPVLNIGLPDYKVKTLNTRPKIAFIRSLYRECNYISVWYAYIIYKN